MATNISQSPDDKTGAPVVVVDDDPSFLRAMGRLVRAAGFKVEMFGSPRKFLEALPELSPRVLVLDVHMPEMTGLELHERLVASGVHLPVVFVTAFDTPQTRERASKAGSAGLLLKPFDEAALLQAISSATGARKGSNPA